MGLDQSWVVRDSNGETEDLHSHRKVPALEAFMAAKWHESRKKVPVTHLEVGDEPIAEADEHAVFNCEFLDITSEILDELQVRVTERTLDTNASGFFWGRHDDADYEDIQEAIDKARLRLDCDEEVIYTSWW